MRIFSKEEHLKNKILSSTQVKCDFSAEMFKNEFLADLNSDNINILKNKLVNNVKVDSDSMFIPAILVASVWNKNNIIFTPDEIIKARFTPVDKYVNWMHNNNEKNNNTIGTIVSAETIDADYKVLSDEQLLEPQPYAAIAIGMLVWSKTFPTYAEKIVEGIKNKTLFVSNECYMNDFGYALREMGKDQIILLDRNEDNAGLTSYLIDFDGPGIIKIEDTEYEIGRWVKDLTFCGVGFVYKPAVPESIILSETQNTCNKYIFVKKDNFSVLNLEGNINMAQENTKNEVEKVAEVVVSSEKTETETENLEPVVSSLKDEIAKNKQDYEKLVSENTELKQNLEKLLSNFNTLKSKLDAIEKAKIGLARLESMEKYVNIEDREKSINEFAEMTDKEFSAVLSYTQSAHKKSTEMKCSDAIAATDVTNTDLKKATEAVASMDTTDMEKQNCGVEDKLMCISKVKEDESQLLEKFIAEIYNKS